MGPFPMLDHLEGLNPEQRDAATTEAANCVVVAGAGTGKTKTMAARVCHLISKGVKPEQILAITFTRRAAAELVSRIAAMAGSENGRRVQAMTFHSWCSRLISGDRSKAYTIIDPDDVQDMLSLARGKQDKGFPRSPELASIYSYCRNSGMKLSDYLDRHMPKLRLFLEDIKEIFQKYEHAKRQQQLLDLDDVLAVVAKNMEREDFARTVAATYRHILIDEFQDTNPLQWKLIAPLIGKVGLFCVGDAAQAIYAFRGANYRFIVDFCKRVPGAIELPLNQNYRSPNACLAISNWLMGDSPIEYDKKLWSENAGDKPLFHIFATQIEEAEFIADKILEDHSRGIPFNSNLIVFRSSMYKKLVDAALTKRNIPVNYIGGTTFMKASHVRDVIAPIRILHNEDDGMAWIRFLQIFPGVGEESSSAMFDALREVPGMEAKLTVLHTGPRRKFEEAARVLNRIVKMATLSVRDMIGEIAKALDPYLEKRYRDEWHGRKNDIPLLQTIAAKEESMAAFLENYSLNPLVEVSTRGMETITDKVTLSTVHGAKGAEADIVYVPALMPGHYPPAYAETADDVEEERRILYVALTRAKRELHLSRPLERGMVFGRRVDDAPNYFLDQMPEHLVTQVPHFNFPQTPAVKAEFDFEDFGIEM